MWGICLSSDEKDNATLQIDTSCLGYLHHLNSQASPPGKLPVMLNSSSEQPEFWLQNDS